MDAKQTREETMRALEHEIGVIARRIRRNTDERARLIHPDLAAAAYSLLAAVADDGPCRASTLADTFSLDKGAVSRYLTQLEELGLLSRTPDPADGRASLLEVTDEGRRRLADMLARRRAMIGDRLSSWSDEDLARLAETLGRYNRTLSKPMI
ncbi:MAG TPA: MarR family transcriptional regulator [Marmoricola sp.]|nr:MarR family transcriptional regulator [Marmoricola sp.]